MISLWFDFFPPHRKGRPAIKRGYYGGYNSGYNGGYNGGYNSGYNLQCIKYHRNYPPGNTAKPS